MQQDDDARPWLRSYAPGVPADVETPTEPLTAALAHAAAQHPSRVAGPQTVYRRNNRIADDRSVHSRISPRHRPASSRPRAPTHGCGSNSGGAPDTQASSQPDKTAAAAGTPGDPLVSHDPAPGQQAVTLTADDEQLVWGDRDQLERALANLIDNAVLYGDRASVAVMSEGRIVETGQRDELFERPEHESTRTLLHAVREQRRTGATRRDVSRTRAWGPATRRT